MAKYTKLEKWEMLNKLDAKDDLIAKLKAQLKKQQDAIHEALQCKCLDAGLCDDCRQALEKQDV